MAKQKEKISLDFDGLIARYKKHFFLLPDHRKGLNKKYKMTDIALGAFSVFFTQQPSFLAHQKMLKNNHNRSNAESLFCIDEIPSDSQIRNTLDPINPNVLGPLYDEIFQGLEQHGYLKEYRCINNSFLVAIDGTQQLSSEKVHCKNCSTQKHRNGKTTYSHKVITPVLVAPGNSKVISLAPEFITPQDGHNKQDSEHAASKRWLEKHGHKLTKYGKVTVLGDDLYAHQPQIEAIKARGMNFILTCKEKSHTKLYEEINELEKKNKIQKFEVKRTHKNKKYKDSYRFFNQVPIKGGDSPIMVNWCELTTTNEAGKVTYYNTFITDITLTSDNVITVISNGRARWYIENGNNNTLKTKGYHLTHNFGHGKQHLASFLLSLNLLSFLFHTVLHLHDKRYKAIRDHLPTRKYFFQSIGVLTSFIVFQHWLHMMKFMVKRLEIKIPDTS